MRKNLLPIRSQTAPSTAALPDPIWDWRVVRTRCLHEARRVLRNREDAEEAVQEAMARAWRRRAACTTPEDPIGWLLTITRNEALRVLERLSRRSEREVATSWDPPESRFEQPIDDLLSELATRDAIACLRPDDQVLIHLHYRHDLSQAEVARRLDLPEGTIKVRLHRIRARLRDAWPEDNQA